MFSTLDRPGTSHHGARKSGRSCTSPVRSSNDDDVGSGTAVVVEAVETAVAVAAVGL